MSTQNLANFQVLNRFFFPFETLTHQLKKKKRKRETKPNELMKKFLFLVKEGVLVPVQIPYSSIISFTFPFPAPSIVKKSTLTSNFQVPV